MLSIALAVFALQAAPQAAPAPVVVEPAWVRYPQLGGGGGTTRGRARSLPDGEVRVTCTVTIEGKLDGCRVISDTSIGERLGPAAIRASRDARMSPRTVNGQPEPGEVTITLNSAPAQGN